MIEWLIIPAAAASVVLFPKMKMKDERKIQQIFENKNVYITRGEKENAVKKFPKLMYKTKEVSHITYSYKLPLGIEVDNVKKLPFAEGLNKEVEIDFDGYLKLHVYDNKLPDSWKYDEGLIKPDTWLVPIGMNHQGILYHDFDKYPHMLVGGVTRFGKTVFIKEAFHTLLMNQLTNAEFYILDLKGGLEFGKYQGIPQVKGVASDVFEAAELLADIAEDLKKKEKFFRIKGYTNITDTPIQKRTFIIVDEGAELSPNIVVGDAKKYAKFCQAALSEIARIGGGIGYRLLYCTQYPTKEAVPMQIKMNIVTRLSFIAAARVASQVILDEPGAEDLPAIPGRAIYKVEKQRFVQVPYIDDKMMFSMMEAKENVINADTNRKPVDHDRQVGNGENPPPSTNA